MPFLTRTLRAGGEPPVVVLAPGESEAGGEEKSEVESSTCCRLALAEEHGSLTSLATKLSISTTVDWRLRAFSRRRMRVFSAAWRLRSLRISFLQSSSAAASDRGEEEEEDDSRTVLDTGGELVDAQKVRLSGLASALLLGAATRGKSEAKGGSRGEPEGGVWQAAGEANRAS